MFATLLAISLTLSANHCEEFSAEVRLLSSRIHRDAKKNCDLLIARSPALWKNGGFRDCHAKLSIKTEKGGSITPYMITVNTTNIENFATNATNVEKFTFINQQLNLNAQGCATATGPNLQKPLSRFPTSYPVEINVYTTTAEQEDVNCITVVNIIRKASPLLRPNVCQHEATQSEIAQVYHHRFKLNLPMPDTNERPVTETVALNLLRIQRGLEFERSICAPIRVPMYDSIRKTWNFRILLSENRTSIVNCNTISDLANCLPKSCELEMISGDAGPQILYVQFEASICGQLVGPAAHKGLAFLFNSFLNGMNARCPVISYSKTKNAFDKAPHEGYYYALVSGPSHVDVCQEAKNHIQYGDHICEQIQNINRTSANTSYQSFRMRLKERIYIADIPWYMNEHSKFIHFLNACKSICNFNGYVQLNESEAILGVNGHTSWSLFP